MKPLHRPCLAETSSGAACIQHAVGDTDLCPVHTGPESKRAFMQDLAKRSHEARAARKEALLGFDGDRVELQTVEQCQDVLERAAGMMFSGAAPKGFGSDVKNIVSMARVILDVKGLQKENKELRKLLNIKKSAVRNEG